MKIKKILIGLIITILLLGGFVFYLLSDAKSFIKVKEELIEKNNVLSNKIEMLHVKNMNLDKMVKEKDILIEGYEKEITLIIHKIFDLKKEIKMVNSFKKSEEFKSLLECNKNYDKLRLNCLKIEEEAETCNTALGFYIKINEEMNSKVSIKNELLKNKDKEIVFLNEQCDNYENSIKDLERVFKKEKFRKIRGTVIKVLVAAVIGFGLGRI